MSNRICPDCSHPNAEAARFCARCGAVIPRAGRADHAPRLPVPVGFTQLDATPQLATRMESALGGKALLGTEGVLIDICNLGLALVNLRFRILGRDRDGHVALHVVRELETLDHGERTRLEVPSYEIATPIHSFELELVEAGTAPAH